MLNQAIKIMTAALIDNYDKAGQTKVLHSIRVMNNLPKHLDEIHKCVAVLHDVVEDSHISIDYLEQFFPKEVTEAVSLLTHKTGSYEAYIYSLLENPIAMRVKIADLEDNMDLTRLEKISDSDLNRNFKYHTYHQYLLRAISLI